MVWKHWRESPRRSSYSTAEGSDCSEPRDPVQVATRMINAAGPTSRKRPRTRSEPTHHWFKAVHGPSPTDSLSPARYLEVPNMHRVCANRSWEGRRDPCWIRKRTREMDGREPPI